MKALKWISISLAALVLIAGVIAAIFVQTRLEPLLKNTVETKASAAIQGQVRLESVSLQLFPLALRFASVSAQSAELGLDAKIEQVNLRSDAGLLGLIGALVSGGRLGRVDLEVVSPQAKLSLKDKPKEENETEDDTPLDLGKTLSGLPPIAVHVAIQNGALALETGTSEATRVVLDETSLDFQTAPLRDMAGDVKLSAKARLEQGEWKAGFPLRLDASFKTEGDRIAVAPAKGEVFGVAFTGEGQQDLASGKAQWSLKALVEDLAKLPVPPSFLPPGSWTGRIEAGANLKAESKTAGWNVDGSLKLERLEGQTKWTQKDFGLDGKVKAHAELAFQARPMVTPEASSGASSEASAGASKASSKIQYQIDAPKLVLSADLTEASVTKKDLLAKPHGVPLSLNVSGHGGTQSGRLEALELVFAQLKLNAQGDVAFTPDHSSAIEVKMERTRLDGLERYIPMLAESPVKGTVQIAAQIKGDLSKPESASLLLKPLLLEKVEASIKLNDEAAGRHIQGPLKLDGSVELEAIGEALQAAKLRLQADLSKLDLRLTSEEKQDLFIKKPDLPLTLQLHTDLGSAPGAKAKSLPEGGQIQVRTANLQVGQSRLTAQGRISRPQRPELALSFSLPAVSLTELSEIVPKLKASGITGTMSGQAQLNGTWDFKGGLTQSPLRLEGDLKAQIPSFKLEKSEKTASGAKTPPEKAPAPEPLLPDWPIARTAKLKTEIKITKLDYGSLPIEGVVAQTTLNQGQLNGQVSVQKIFGGSVQAKNLAMNVALARPEVRGQADFRNLLLDEAAGFASEEWRKLVNGRTSGTVDFSLPHSSQPDFLNQIKASGDLQIANGFVSTLRLDNVINESLVKIPALAQQGVAVKSNGVAADIGVLFRLEAGKLALSKFSFLTPEQNEIQASGTVGLDKSVSLDGFAHLAQTSIGGSVREANSDSLGRFVIPVRIQGDLTRPQAQIAQQAVEAVLKKTADHEIKKASNRVQDDLRKEGQKKVDQLKEELGKKGLKGLEDLIK